MPRYRVELQRVKPGDKNSISVEQGLAEVTADDLDGARNAGRALLESDSSDIEWIAKGNGVKSANGVGHVLSVHGLGPKDGSVENRLHRSPVAVGDESSEVRRVQADKVTRGEPLIKTQPGVRLISANESAKPRFVNGYRVDADGHRIKPDGTPVETGVEDADVHPDDTDQWTAQQRRNAEAAGGQAPNPSGGGSA